MDDAAVLRKALTVGDELHLPTALGPDDELATDWRLGGYPYRNLMLRQTYEKQKYHLQVELLKLQAWVKGENAADGIVSPLVDSPAKRS